MCVLLADFYQVFQNCFMADKKRKIEEIMSDLKTNSEKKMKSGDSPKTRKSKMAANKEIRVNNGKNASETESETHEDISGEQSLRNLMLDISKDKNYSISGLNERISQMEENLDHKLVEKLSSIINVTVKEEVQKVRSDLDSEICAIRTKVMYMEEAVKDFRGITASTSNKTQTCSVVIRNLKEGRNESNGANSVTKVISLVRGGIKLKDVRVTTAPKSKSDCLKVVVLLRP